MHHVHPQLPSEYICLCKKTLAGVLYKINLEGYYINLQYDKFEDERNRQNLSENYMLLGRKKKTVEVLVYI